MKDLRVNHIKYCTGCGKHSCIILNIIEDADHLPPCDNPGEKWFYVKVESGYHSYQLAKELTKAIEENGSKMFLDRTGE